MNHTLMKPRMTRINSKGSLHRLKHQKELLWKRKRWQMVKTLWLELTALCCRSILCLKLERSEEIKAECTATAVFSNMRLFN